MAGVLGHTWSVADENEPPAPAKRRTSDSDTAVPPEGGLPDQAKTGDQPVVIGGLNDRHVATGNNSSSDSFRIDYDGASLVETADEALKRQAQGEIVNEVLAGGAMAASFTAVASITKAKLEATTQRRKNDLDAETQRLKIASDERVAGLQAMKAEAPETGDA